MNKFLDIEGEGLIKIPATGREPFQPVVGDIIEYNSREYIIIRRRVKLRDQYNGSSLMGAGVEEVTFYAEPL